MKPTGAGQTVEEIAAAVRALPGLRAKAPIALVAEVLGGSDWEAGPGDDGAVVAAGDETCPAARVTADRVVWLADEAAAGDLA